MLDIDTPRVQPRIADIGDWVLLRVRPSFEDIAREFLEKQVRGCSIYYPCGNAPATLHPPRVSRPVEVSRRPAYQGYVYARFSEYWPDWQKVETYCSAQPRIILRLAPDQESKIPIRIRQSEIDQLRLDEAAGKFDHKPVELPPELLGMMVRIPNGPLMGHSGKIKYISGDFVGVSVRMLGKPTVVQLTIDDILENLA